VQASGPKAKTLGSQKSPAYLGMANLGGRPHSGEVLALQARPTAVGADPLDLKRPAGEQ
jgi:hypothetical protein